MEKAQVRKATEKRAMKIEKKSKQREFWLSKIAGSANRHQLQSIEEVNSISERERETWRPMMVVIERGSLLGLNRPWSACERRKEIDDGRMKDHKY